MKTIAYNLLETLTIVSLFGGLGWLIADSWRVILKHGLAARAARRNREIETSSDVYMDTEEIE